MSTPDVDVDTLTEQLVKTSIPKEEGVSFVSQALKLNTAKDAQPVVDKINDCPQMVYLNLEGNTVGVEAAEAIAKALETKSQMKKALWKDMFTGRMKNEIPIALKHLSRGLMKANAQLEILDLSDNASGPIGVEGIVDLLKSPTCYTLKELKLNNMGLGITGAKMLASALNQCYEKSKEAGTPLGLRVFIAGRNRLENEGAAALAAVFEKMGTLEEIQVPQNGIYLPGVRALSKAFSKNVNLKEINLNDNTLNPEGSSEVAKSLANLHGLVKLDLGDCLMKNQGALYLAKAIEMGHPNLEEVLVYYNSIKVDGGMALLSAMKGKQKLKKLNLDGNKFGKGGIDDLRDAASNINKASILGSLSEDEGSDSDTDDDDEDRDDDECEDEQESEGDTEEEDEEDIYDDDNKEEDLISEVSSDEEENNYENIQSGYSARPKVGTAKEFLLNPSMNNFNRLGDEVVSSLIQDVKDKPFEAQLDELIKVIMSISSLIQPNENLQASRVMSAGKELYDVLFKWAEERNHLSYVNNTLPVYLGLIKDEETKKPLKNKNFGGCMFLLNQMLKEKVFPQSTRDIIIMLTKSRTQA